MVFCAESLSKLPPEWFSAKHRFDQHCHRESNTVSSLMAVLSGPNAPSAPSSFALRATVRSMLSAAEARGLVGNRG